MRSVGYLADMATSLTAARQLTLYAAREADEGRRVDMEAGMAKLFASETAMQIALNAVRIQGGYGYSTEFDVERYFRQVSWVAHVRGIDASNFPHLASARIYEHCSISRTRLSGR